MDWLFHRNYLGPDRRRGGFEVRFINRRKNGPGNSSNLPFADAVGALFKRGLKWVDALSYFGPDRRSGAFSHFILERRKSDAAKSAPPLHSALRQLRVRVLGTESAEERARILERLLATAVLAEANGRGDIAASLHALSERLAAAPDDNHWASTLQSGLRGAEAMLDG